MINEVDHKGAGSMSHHEVVVRDDRIIIVFQASFYAEEWLFGEDSLGLDPNEFDPQFSFVCFGGYFNALCLERLEA